MKYNMEIVKQAEAFCTDLLSASKCKELPFHNLVHTKEVVAHVQFLCDTLKVNSKDQQIVLLSAWFHDTGFSEIYDGHEEVSKQIAKGFLTKSDLISTEDIEEVCSCIDATKIPQKPTNYLAEILCDADVMHISNSQFFYRKLLLRREWELFCNKKVDDLKWHQVNLEFLVNHKFKTNYGKDKLEEGKQVNVQKVKNILSYYENGK